jgi:hypothetical protein
MQELMNNMKYSITTVKFDGWVLKSEQIKLLNEFMESDNGCNQFSEYIYDVGNSIDVENAIEYCEDDEACEDDEPEKVAEFLKILKTASDEGIDFITFYK